MLTTPGQFTFSGGEMARELGGRTDLAAWYNTILKSENFEVDAQGQLRFRGGSTFVAVTKGNSPAMLAPFIFSSLQSYVLEFTNLVMRVYKDRGIIESSPGTPMEVVTPWGSSILFELRYDQDVDVMYVCHATVKPNKITRTGHTSWSINPVSFIDGPFLPLNTTATTITLSGTGATATMTASAALFASTDVGRQVRWKDGTNWFWYTITAFTDSTHVTVSKGSSGTPAATTATVNWRLGVFSDTTGWPVACQFYEKRMYYLKDQVLYGSKAAIAASDYDTFTEGVEADDPVTYVLLAETRAEWLQEAQTFLGIGTFGSVRRASGGTNEDPITPTSISIKSVSEIGVASIQPILSDRSIIYVARDLKTLLTLEYDALQDAYVSRNRNITAQHITRPGIVQMAYQFASNAKIWLSILNGKLGGLTFLPEQQVYGWHSHKTQGMVTSLAAIPIVQGGDDDFWMVVKRSLNGVDTYCVEYRVDEVEYPNFEDYYTSETGYDTDLYAYLADLYEAQKKAIHLDCSLTYDGRLATTLTLSNKTVGTGRIVTAGSAIFSSGMVGRQITGAPTGRAQITGYTDSTHVTVEVITEFESTSLASQEWYLTTNQVSGLTHLANMTVTGVGDGQHITSVAVNGSGVATVGDQYGMLHIGLGYEGLIIGNTVEGGSQLGTSQTKPKNILELAVRFLHTLGPLLGTELYKANLPAMQRCEFPKVNLKGGWATPLFTGDYAVPVADSWSRDKRWYINQRAPLPCKVQLVVPRFDTVDG